MKSSAAETREMRMLAPILSTREIWRFDFYEIRSVFTKLYDAISNQ